MPESELRKPIQTVIVELTNRCNLRCPFCTTHVAMSRPHGFMDLSLFDKLIKDLTECAPRATISMNMCGEPLLHKQAHQFVQKAVANGFHTFISTNGTQCTPSNALRLIKAGLSSIAFCVDGAFSASHEAYRIGSRFEQVKKNVEAFLALRHKLGVSYPKVCIQTLITSFSEGELPDVLEWAWAIAADEVHFKTLSLGSNVNREQQEKWKHLIPQNPLLRRSHNKNEAYCRAPLEQAIVYWDGSLGICCVDYNNEAQLPSIHSRHLRDLLYDPATINARRQGYQQGWNLCRRCQSVGTSFRGLHIHFEYWRQSAPAHPDRFYFQQLLNQLIDKAHHNAD